MVYGHTPFHDVPADKKSQHIMDKTIPIKYPSMVTFRPKTGSDENVIIGETTIDVLKHCLSRDPATRLSAKALLDHAFFHPS
jgi:serine/threonine protein kinase